jgi:iron complex outermembrane recepter protein
MGKRAKISRPASSAWASRLFWALTHGAAIAAAVGGTGFTAWAEDDNAQATAPAAAKSDQSGTLEEIVVTARKRSEDLRDIPASIVAISDSTIVDAHMTQIDDIGALVSNLHIVQRNDNSPDVTLRGVGSFGVVQGVGFFMNDVQLFEGQIIRPNDIERIEVLKGPQGTLYGGANIGGAIKYITKDPTDTLQGEATVEVGQYDTRNYEAILSGPLIENTLEVRASFYDDNHNGYTYDTVHNEEFGETMDHGGRMTVLYKPDQDTKVHFYFSVDDFITAAQNLLYTPPNDDTYYYSVNDYFVPSFVRRLWSPTLQIDHQFGGDVALTAITSYFWSYNRGVTDLFKHPVPVGDDLDQNEDHRVLSQEVRLASTGDSNFQWLGGLFFQRHHIELENIDNFITEVQNPVLVGTDLDRDEKVQKEYALFGDVTYRWNDWQYELGLRGDYYTSEESAYNNSLSPILDTAAHLDGHEFSPRVSVQYKFSPTLNVYATLAKGFEPGDEIEENGVVHPYKAETATSYEVGMKSLLSRSVQFNSALFYINYDNRLYQNIQFTPYGLIEVTQNIGSSQNYGGEFDLAAALPYGFKLSGGFGFTIAKWGNVPYIDPATSLPINLNGRTAPFTPAYSGNITPEWSRPIGGGYTVGARVNASFTGRSYWDPQDSTMQRAYQLVDVGAHVGNERWTVSAHLANATGTRYNTIYDPTYDIGLPFNVAHINPPRWFVASATVRF